MKKSFDSLRNKYPNLLKDTEIICMHGWYDLVGQLTKKISQLEFANKIKVVQIKEKFGALRYYVSPLQNISDIEWKQIWDLEMEYGKKSLVVCESCGKPGELTSIGGCMMVRCEICLVEDSI